MTGKKRLKDGNDSPPALQIERVITDEDVPHALATSFSEGKKWRILTVIFLVQISMNFNASIYSNAVPLLVKKFGTSHDVTVTGQAVFLLAYGFGCELWAPWSEEFGRKPILQASLGLVNIFAMACGLSQNMASIIIFRCLGGLGSAGGSVTLALVADMFESHRHQFATAYVVFSSVAGSVIGPVVGGFLETYLGWRWNFWVQLIFGGVVQLAHLVLVPETHPGLLLGREAKRQRQTQPRSRWVFGPKEGKKFDRREILKTMFRPYHMLLTEPIVLCLSLYSGFSDSLVFTFLAGFPLVFDQWGFDTIAKGLTFLSLLLGYALAWLFFIPFYIRQRRAMHRLGPRVRPEIRLYPLLFLAPLEALGLFGFAWTSLGPSYGVPWILPLCFATLVGIANHAIYLATIDYMIAAYGVYSASATGGNGFARDFLAGIAAWYSEPLFTEIGSRPPPFPYVYASNLLAALAVVVTIPIYVFYWHGEWFRERSRFAQSLSAQRGSRTDRVVARREKGGVGADVGAAPVVVADLGVLVEEEGDSEVEAGRKDDGVVAAAATVVAPK